LLYLQLYIVNTDSDNTDSQFTRTNFFGPARSPWFYIQLLMDNRDSANANVRLTQTTFSTCCHKNASVSTDCVAIGTPQLPPVGRQLFTDGSYYNYARPLATLRGHLDIQLAKWNVGHGLLNYYSIGVYV